MDLQQIINLFRIESFDTTTPYLFSDTACAIWATEAETEAAIRKKLLRENNSVHLTQFDVRPGVRSYPRDPRMFEIVYANFIYKGGSLLVPWPLGITTSDAMDGQMYAWRTIPFRPSGIILYDSTLEVNCNPDTDYVIHTEGYRLPMAPLGLRAVGETLASGSLTLTGGASGSVDTVLVNGINILGSSVPFNATLGQTATDVAAQITLNTNRYSASAVGAVITLTDLVGTGSLHNGYAVSAATTGITASSTVFTGGIDAVVSVPEISAIHHRHLVKWMLYRAYSTQDSETLNLSKASSALAEFEAVFGERPDADYRRHQNESSPHHVMSYA